MAACVFCGRQLAGWEEVVEVIRAQCPNCGSYRIIRGSLVIGRVRMAARMVSNAT